MDCTVALDFPHRRLNPLTREWVLVSPHRARRPWLGQVESAAQHELPPYDPACYLCPGNRRAAGVSNPFYTGTYSFDNDFSSLLPPDQVHGGRIESALPAALFRAETETGLCRVICFSPRHDLTLPELDQAGVEEVVRTWADQTVDLGKHDYISYVQVFENKGAVMGCSNPHPHSQAWATSHIPNEPQKELATQNDYAAQTGGCLLCDYLAGEHSSGERLVASNDHFTALVPYWAVWPFEVLLLSKRHFGSLADMHDGEVQALADLLRTITARYDNLFQISFPYSMGFHQAPTDGIPHHSWHFHAHFYPPLLRSATVRKFMVGFELLAQPQRDITPETAAERLHAVSDVHYKAAAR
jgi:UDPglucose--hexose-1-phosphate uridylyltransferase